MVSDSQDGPLYVIVEYAEHGNLRDFLRKFHNSQGSANIGRPPNLTLHPLVMQKDFCRTQLIF